MIAVANPKDCKDGSSSGRRNDGCKMQRYEKEDGTKEILWFGAVLSDNMTKIKEDRLAKMVSSSWSISPLVM